MVDSLFYFIFVKMCTYQIISEIKGILYIPFLCPVSSKKIVNSVVVKKERKKKPTKQEKELGSLVISFLNVLLNIMDL